MSGDELSVPKTDTCVEDCKEGVHGYGCPYDGDIIQEVPVTVKVQDTDLGASKPVPQPVYKTRPTQHSTVVACGHKIDLRHSPSNANCWPCWEAFFSVSPEGVEQVHQLLLNGGTQEVIRRFGSKFTKKFGEFLRKKLLSEYASREVRAASGIEGSIMSIAKEKEASFGSISS